MEKRVWFAWEQYRIVIWEDEVFYRNVIDRVVRFYRLHDFVQEALDTIDVSINYELSADGQASKNLTEVEQQAAKNMVYEAVIYLGDLERYSCTLDDLEYAPGAPEAPDDPSHEPTCRKTIIKRPCR
jgi:hypothetical protein